MNIANIRKEYMQHSLSETDADPNAFRQFDRWWAEAVQSEIEEVNAMTLATVNTSGHPTARIVLLKGYDERGFVFYTNYHSNKAQDLSQEAGACLVFFWKELERQVRIIGVAEKVTAEESDAYFASRPLESQLGAYASDQSSVVASRAAIEARLEAVKKQWQDRPIARPSHWGGYRVIPKQIEFWQGRPSRLHDRLLYTLIEEGIWKMERLMP